jgi:hypothetical protein
VRDAAQSKPIIVVKAGCTDAAAEDEHSVGLLVVPTPQVMTQPAKTA